MKKLYSFIFFLFLNYFSHGQELKFSEIEKEIHVIEQNLGNYELSHVSWNEFMNQNTDDQGEVKVWRQNNCVRKIIEEISGEKGTVTRVIYLKNGKPIKGIETEQVFEKQEHNRLKETFKLEVFVIGYNSIIDEYEFETKETGKRTFTEMYCDLSSLFYSINKLNSI
ncbi:hypothetical protein [Formosa sp. S-31]|uniref:hypothetical protein n=1 Tax=Formosa sp. S-31 TaxID=2790949 RepID=UPI003EBB2380